MTTQGSPVKYSNQIPRLLEAVHLPVEVLVSHCKGHQKGNTKVAGGIQAADHASKRSALQNNDLIGIATLVLQTNFPETPSYIEGETLKAKSEGFQEDVMGGSRSRDSFFCLGTSNGSLLTPYMLPLI